MQVDDLSSIDPNVDYTQILPIQQKRTIAFINHFVMNTVSFLNTFAQSCESRLMEFEYKIQKVEASLMILESQLASISGLDENEGSENKQEVRSESAVEETGSVPAGLPEIVTEVQDVVKIEGPVASEDPRYQKFFKMVQFGVPAPAVKLKMQTEGVNPNILDTPSAIIPGYSSQVDDGQHSNTSSDSS